MISRVGVFAGASSGARPSYRLAAENLGRMLAARRIGVVFGGGRRGLMGALADATLGSGGQVIGVIPAALEAKELAHRGLTELRVVQSMHERKAMTMLKTIALLATFGVVAFSALPQGATAASARGSAKGPQTSSPPGDVSRVGQPGVTSPRVLRKVGVRYTARAVAAGIEGSVIVECVVRTNGTVDAVRVVKSLDSVYGLDDEAVLSAKQWRFTPGMKDGVAVPVLITIDLAFRLTNKEGAVPFQAPALFESVPSAKNFTANVMSVVDPPPDWPEIQKDAPGVHVRLLHPQGWRVSDDASPSGWLIAQSEDGSCVFLVSALRPATWAQSTGGGATRSELSQLGGAFQRRLSATRSRARVEASGWMPLSRIWVWYEMRVLAGDPSMPPTIAPDDQRRFDGARWWRFIRNVGSQEIAVDCFVMRLRGASKAEVDKDVRQAGPLFLTMLRRMLITAQ